MVSFGVNDMHLITYQQVPDIVRPLCVSYARLRPRFLTSESRIKRELDNGDLDGAVQLLLDVFDIPDQLFQKIGYNAAHLPAHTLAAIRMYHTASDDRLVCANLIFSKSKAQVLQTPRRQLIQTLAHELAHARMYHDRHVLRESEFATDVLALLVTGSAGDYDPIYAGYIRKGLYQTVLRSLHTYGEVVYL